MTQQIWSSIKNAHWGIKLLGVYGVAAIIGEATGKYSIIPFVGTGQKYVDKRMPRSSAIARNILAGGYAKYPTMNNNMQTYVKGLGGFRLSALPDPTTPNLLVDGMKAGGAYDSNVGWSSQTPTGMLRAIWNRLRY